MRRRLQNRSIILVEDSDEDYEAIVWAFRQAGVLNPVYRCATAAEVADLYPDHPARPGALRATDPILVLLDLNIAGTNWRETLTDLRSDDRWRGVPVVAVSTSDQPTAVSEAYGLGAAGYLQKLLDLDTFAAAIKRLAAYWLETVVPPPLPQPDVFQLPDNQNHELEKPPVNQAFPKA
jgi:DNA-binding NarL/FixJ family response regulator